MFEGVSTFRFRSKVFFPILFLVIAVVTSLAYLFVIRQTAIIEKDLNKRADLLVMVLANNLKVGILAGSEEFIGGAVKSATDIDDVLGVSVYDAKGSILREVRKKGYHRTNIVPKAEMFGENLLSRHFDHEGQVDVAAPVYYIESSIGHGDLEFYPVETGKKTVIGYAVLSLNKGSIVSANRSVRDLAILMGVIFCLLGGLTAYWIASRVTHPLSDLVENIREMGIHGLRNLPVRGDYELRELSSAFNAMASNLKEEKAFTENALNILKDIFLVFDFDGRFLRWNKAVTRVSGLSDGDIASKRVSDFIPSEEINREAFEDLITRGHKTVELSVTTKDGVQVPYEFTGALLRNAEKKRVGISVMGRDITERRRHEEALKESESKYRNLFESSHDVIVLLDKTGAITDINPRAEQLTGYSQAELRKMNVLHHLTVLEDQQIFQRASEEALRGGQSEYAVRWRTKDGGIVFFDGLTVPRRSAGGEVLSLYCTLRDITERKRDEELIQRQLQKLSALRAVDMAISASFDLRITLKVFLEHVVAELGVDAADVLLFNPHSKTLKCGARQGFRTGALLHSHLRLGEGYAGVAALENRIVGISNLKEDDGGFSRAVLLKGEDFVTYYGVPLVAKGHVKGVLEIFHRSPLQPDGGWFDFLEALALQASIAIDNDELFYELERSNMDLLMSYDSTIEGWSRALDYRDKETEGHSQRVTEMTSRIARSMGISEEELVHVRRGALLHDIGKMGIPDSILLKPGPLTEEEWKIMRLHPVYAHELLYPITYLRAALDIPYCHHEKWDGTGYPRGLKGEQIPLSARIFAIVDVWDALRSDRPYRLAWEEEKTKEYIRSLSGIQFDPKVVDVFLNMSFPGVRD
jgi:PAS domain S-box-containing protein